MMDFIYPIGARVKFVRNGQSLEGMVISRQYFPGMIVYPDDGSAGGAAAQGDIASYIIERDDGHRMTVTEQQIGGSV